MLFIKLTHMIDISHHLVYCSKTYFGSIVCLRQQRSYKNHSDKSNIPSSYLSPRRLLLYFKDNYGVWN